MVERQRIAPVDPAERFKSLLAIDRDVLDDCLMEQPQVYYDVSEACVRSTATRDQVKLEFEELTAQLDQDIRAEAVAKEEKLTEASLQNRLRTLPKIQEKQRELLAAKKEADDWQALKEAFQQRSFMLRELVALYIAQRRDVDLEHGAGQSRANLTAARAEQVRDAARKARRG